MWCVTGCLLTRPLNSLQGGLHEHPPFTEEGDGGSER